MDGGSMYKICLVEDEEQLNSVIKSYMEKEGYIVTSFFNGNDAYEFINTEKIDLWVLDIMLKDSVSGYDILKRIRETDSRVPVIFTSARDQDLDKILGLELGSDDYITKPYIPKELMLRINKLIKRTYHDEEKVKYLTYSVDTRKRIVTEEKNEIILTTLEFDLLMLFLNNINRSFGRDEILNVIWGDDYFGTDRAVDDLVRRLRGKMPKLNINTIYGFGYRLT